MNNFTATQMKRFNEFNLLGDVGRIENESSKIKAVRSQQSFEFAMAGVTYAKEASNFRRIRMENMNARCHSLQR
jgi:hypothetical protein